MAGRMEAGNLGGGCDGIHSHPHPSIHHSLSIGQRCRRAVCTAYYQYQNVVVVAWSLVAGINDHHVQQTGNRANLSTREK